jgi:GR25 family glycosyltransferase involved in LPS biosynthesis
MENVAKLIPHVINIEYRTDRFDAIQKEFDRLHLPYTRVDAIYNKHDGALGCLESHIKALRMAQNQPIWICEDDCKFLVERHVIDSILETFLNSDAEVLLLGYSDRKHIDYNDVLYRTFDCQTASSYIVKPSFQNKLIDLWESVAVCRKIKVEHPLYRKYMSLPLWRGDYYFNDQSWKVLQQDHIFVIPKERCVIQRESYSDIEHKIVNYNT